MNINHTLISKLKYPVHLLFFFTIEEVIYDAESCFSE